MSVNFPASLDSGTTLPNPTTGSFLNSPSHAGLHDNENAAIIATQTKLGIGSSTPVANTFLFGTGTGASTWQTLTSAAILAAVSDETGTGNLVFNTTPTLVTPKVDTINEATTNNGVTVAGMNIKAGQTSGTNLTAGTVGNSQLATGVCVQQVNALFTAVATGSTTIPLDDTIPQNTEGDQYMTITITPKSTTNILVIDVIILGANSASAYNLIAALFQDSTVNALAADVQTGVAAGAATVTRILYTMATGTTSATTFKVRMGANVAGTTTFNGAAGNRYFGAISKSSMIITEYKV